MRLPTAAGVMWWPDGALRILRPDGYAIVVEPNLWRNGKALMDAVQAAIPPHLYLPHPARPDEAVPQAPGLFTRVARRWGG